MKIVLKTIGPTQAAPPPNPDATKYVRQNWLSFAAYYLATSLAVSLGIAVALFLFGVLGVSKHGNHQPVPVHLAGRYSLALAGVLVPIMFLIQLITGPFVFTKDVVCRKCHTRLKVKRIAFFTGKYSRPPRCPCGGKIEPAFLWNPAP